MTTLMDFLLATLQPRVNDPNNAKMWLPGLLLGMRDSNGDPVLPIQADKQDLGALGGNGGEYVAQQFASNWSIVHNPATAVPDPNNPLPVMVLPEATLAGLQNVTVSANAATASAQGYAVEVTLAFGAYTGPTMSPLTISGRYQLTQSLEVVGTGTIEPVQGTGTFVAVLRNCELVADAQAVITNSGAQRAVGISVQRLELQPIKGKTVTLKFPKLTLDGDPKKNRGLMAAIAQALGSPEGTEAMLTAAHAMLNAADNLDSVNSLLSARSISALDGIFGPMPDGLPVDESSQSALTAVDQYLFDRVRVALGAPGSGMFLPRQLATCSDPVLEPYTNPQVDVPDQTIDGLQYTDITLTGLTLAGGSNAAVPLADAVLARTQFAMAVQLGVLPAGPIQQVPRASGPVSMPVPPAPPVAFSAQFSLVQQGFHPTALAGTLAATISGVTATMTITPAGSDVDDLTVTISGMAADTSQASIVPEVVLDPRDPGLEPILDVMFARPAVQQQIIGALNAALLADAGAISAQFTAIARDAILAQIGG